MNPTMARSVRALLPIKTTIADIEAVTSYLKTQVGWTTLEKAKKTIDSKVVDSRKLEAYKRLGLVDRDGENLRLTERGQMYAGNDETARQEAMKAALREVALYRETLEWIHFSKNKGSIEDFGGQLLA